MALVTFVSLILVLAIGFVPVRLLRRAPNRRVQDDIVGAQHTRLAVVRNASIAYALRMAAFIPLFAWGASGDLRPAVVASACFGLGTWLVYLARRPLLEFVDDALAHDSSITVHAFIARAHGNDPRVRRVAAGVTLCALFGLVIGEALAAAAFLGPMLTSSAMLPAFLFVAALVSIAVTAALSGHSGTMHSAQLQLGMLYFGLFGATLLVLYLHVSARTPLPPHVALAVAFAAVFGVLVLWYRRSRYVDTETIAGGRGEGSRTARALRRFGKALNGWLSVLLVLIVILALMDLHAAGASALARASAAALTAGTRTSGVALLALGLLPLFYPIVDVTNWLRLAAARKDVGVEADGNAGALRGVFAIYAVETTLIGLLVYAFGAIAGVVFAPHATTDGVEAFAARLLSTGNWVAGIASVLLAICVLAAALSTTSALVAAGLCTLRYDVLALPRSVAPPGDSVAASEATATRRALVACLAGLAVAFATAGAIAWMSPRIGFATGVLPALVSTLCCAQLSFAPLVLGPIVARARGGHGAVSPGWAGAILAVGFGTGVAAVAGYLATGVDAWLWSAAPAALGSGFVLFGIGRAASPRAG